VLSNNSLTRTPSGVRYRGRTSAVNLTLARPVKSVLHRSSRTVHVCCRTRWSGCHSISPAGALYVGGKLLEHVPRLAI